MKEPSSFWGSRRTRILTPILGFAWAMSPKWRSSLCQALKRQWDLVSQRQRWSHQRLETPSLLLQVHAFVTSRCGPKISGTHSLIGADFDEAIGRELTKLQRGGL